jgi:hypothetical protein
MLGSKKFPNITAITQVSKPFALTAISTTYLLDKGNDYYL